jgi:hypothetical protein
MRFETTGGINLDDSFRQAWSTARHDARYEIVLTPEQAARGLEKDLVRNGRKVSVTIPGGVRTGSKVRLRNALQVTDGQPGDILIQIRVK